MADEPNDPPDDDEPAPAEPDDDGMDPATLRAALAQARKDAAKYRTKARDLEPLARKAQEQEEASKSDIQKAAERAAQAETRAVEAERRAMVLEVAADKGLTPAQAKRLQGATREELEADADELLATFAPPDSGTQPQRSPKERLRSGSVPDAEDDSDLDPAKLAASVPRSPI